MGYSSIMLLLCTFLENLRKMRGLVVGLLFLVSLCFEAYLYHHWFYYPNRNYPSATTGMIGCLFISNNNLRS